MEKKKLLKSKSFLLITSLIIVIFATTLFIFAKYINDEGAKRNVALEDFAVALEPLIDGNAPTIAADGTITLSAADYEQFTLNLKYEGYGKSYVRVLIEESWIYKDGVTGIQTVLLNPSNNIAYVFGSSTKDNRNVDGYFYIKDIIPDLLGGSYTGSSTIPVITGVNGSSIQLPAYTDSAGVTKDATHVKLSIKVEAVQYNRAEVIWGIALPIT